LSWQSTQHCSTFWDDRFVFPHRSVPSTRQTAAA
jgi:hypothetical protein